MTELVVKVGWSLDKNALNTLLGGLQHLWTYPTTLIQTAIFQDMCDFINKRPPDSIVRRDTNHRERSRRHIYVIQSKIYCSFVCLTHIILDWRHLLFLLFFCDLWNKSKTNSKIASFYDSRRQKSRYLLQKEINRKSAVSIETGRVHSQRYLVASLPSINQAKSHPPTAHRKNYFLKGTTCNTRAKHYQKLKFAKLTWKLIFGFTQTVRFLLYSLADSERTSYGKALFTYIGIVSESSRLSSVACYSSCPISPTPLNFQHLQSNEISLKTFKIINFLENFCYSNES